MPYIGSTPTTQSFISGTDYFNGTGAQTAFTLSRTVASQNDVEAVVNNVVQQPNAGYTISGTTITFTSAPSAGTQNVYVRYLSTTTQSISPSQGTVGWNQLNTDTQQDLGISFKNRIINGAMQIDQRNAGASVTQIASTTYTVDRFFIAGTVTSKFTAQQNAGSVTPPVGFTNYLGCTSSSAYSVGAAENFNIVQRIEGTNVYDLAWGTVNAKTVTLSFWVRSSLTGTFGGSLRNSAADRSYPFSYTIFSANTWEYKTVTVAGDTTGTWLTTTGVGVQIVFSMGAGSTLSGTAGAWASANYTNATGATSVVGTNGATLYLTGVQFEVGTQATTFTLAGGSYGAELALCQRYYYRAKPTNGGSYFGIGQVSSATTTVAIITPFPVTMRDRPTSLEQSGTATDYRLSQASTSLVNCSAVPTYLSSTSEWAGATTFTASTLGGTAGQASFAAANTGANGYLAWSAEL